MSRLRAALVVTTVFDPVLLAGYCENFRRHGHLEDVHVIVVPDRKTPEAAFCRCAELTRKGMRTSCPTIEEQERYLAYLGLDAAFIPYNTDNRRNVGFLMAYESGSDFLISIDDDNYCREEEDYFAAHAVVCEETSRQRVVESRTGFFNICTLLEQEKPGPLYARGFPYASRHTEEALKIVERTIPVHVNAGLWLIDPDADAITWLVVKPRVTGFRGPSLTLGHKTWSPINTQNTALRREAIPSYYYIRMGYPMAGMPIDRYGDIFSGYFTQACMKQLGGYCRIGTPLADHKRNSHNYIRDATNEWGGIQVLEDLLPWLIKVRLEGTSYIEAYRSLSHALQDAVEAQHGQIWTDLTRGYFHQMAYHMRSWLKACERIDSDPALDTGSIR
jgi:hypothetical protein